MTYTPTKKELEELGFYNHNGVIRFLWWKKLWSIGSISYNERVNKFFLTEHEWLPSIIIPFKNTGELVIFLKYFQEEGHKFPQLGFDYLDLYNKLTYQNKILELIDKKRKAYITNIYDQRNLTITVCMFDNFIEKLRQEIRQELEKMENETIKIIDKMIEEYQHCPGEEGFYGLGILGELKSRLSTNL